MEPRTIVASRGKTLLLLLASLGLSAAAIVAIRQPGPTDPLAWFALMMFGPGSMVWAWLLIRPQRLILDARGFTVTGGLTRAARPVAWRDIDGFLVYRLPRGGTMIGLNYAPGAGPQTMLRNVNRRLAGVDAALPKSWPGPPERIAAQLNAYRAAALASGRLR